MAQKSASKAKSKASVKSESGSKAAKVAKPKVSSEKKESIKAKGSVKENLKEKDREAKVQEKMDSEVQAPPKKERKSAAAVRAAAAAAAVLSEEQKKWAELKEKFGADKPAVYSMAGVYSAQTSLTHKVLGWGFVLSNVNDRLEVLFESGKKVLISNYKSG